VVEGCVAFPGYEVFKCCDEKGEIKYVKSRELNAYVKEVIGEEFTTKDFRTWAGTLVALKLAELGLPRT
jgi:DNA topoisomerase I